MPSRRRTKAERERDARAAAAWATFSGGSRQGELADDPNKWLRDSARYETIYNAFTAEAPIERAKFQVDRVKRVLPKCFPTGTDGISTTAVRAKVCGELAEETKRLGCGNPDWHSVNRALERE
jgi:hypothetical protein